MPDEKLFQIAIPQGATFSGLASQYRVDLETLKKLNPQITDINVIRAGDFLNLPKLTLEKAPEDYKKEFQLKMDLLMKGNYGIQMAREKLGKD
jgi:hypothetical protein